MKKLKVKYFIILFCYSCQADFSTVPGGRTPVVVDSMIHGAVYGYIDPGEALRRGVSGSTTMPVANAMVLFQANYRESDAPRTVSVTTDRVGRWHLLAPERAGVANVQVFSSGYERAITDVDYNGTPGQEYTIYLLPATAAVLTQNSERFDPVQRFCKPGYWVTEGRGIGADYGGGSRNSFNFINIYNRYQGEKVLSMLVPGVGKDGIPYSGDEYWEGFNTFT